ncbi:ABC transporter [Photobacterium swingsii]|uniref:ABC transporter permease n=1 Tax=Photobacterium swingsii TaxID=680026 RepID=A0A0J8XX99_9GAMM|nr:ABC transporter permease [Photobacterium swingsii]KMV30009.1 ABC transporter [Photobacterium swingsii]PSW22925.1 ABC transporter permease [Photobacterium swingsii]
MSWRTLIKFELHAIFTNPALLFTVFGGVLIYSFLYPLPYSQQLPREQLVTVVNQDHSQISRELIRMIDATPQVKVQQYARSIDEAKTQLETGEVHGLLVIPAHFNRDLLLGKSPTLAYAGDASYFLVYGTIVEGIATASGTLGAKLKVARMVMSGDNIALAADQFSAIKLNTKPVFNPSMGYINYVVPAVFVLILHQTLLIAVAMLGGGQNEYRLQGGTGYWLRYPAWKIIIVRGLLMMTIYLPLTAYYFGYSFESLGISRLASIGDLLAMTVPFLLAVIFAGMVIGQLIPRRELATVIVLISSIPLIFTAGFIWPPSAIPEVLNQLAQIAPATPAINGFVRLNQMGATFEQVIGWWGQLWGQVIVFGCIASWLMTRAQKASASKVSVEKTAESQ